MPKPSHLKDSIAPLLKDSWRDGLNMDAVRDIVEDSLPALLSDMDDWQSMMIDYEAPYLMRLYRRIDINDDKCIYVNLHYFFPKTPDEIDGINNPYSQGVKDIAEDLKNIALYHPHPWAAGFKILEGSYNQKIGHSHDLGLDVRPEPTKDTVQTAGSSYAFNDPHIWHMVIPRGDDAIMSLMVTHIPQDWEQVGPRPPRKQRELTPAEKEFIFKKFKARYPQRRTPKPPRNIRRAI